MSRSGTYQLLTRRHQPSVNSLVAKYPGYLIGALLTGIVPLLLTSCLSFQKTPLGAGTASVSRPQRQAVAAMGYLRPAGDTRVLAGPSIALGIIPRVQMIYVREGQQVRRGQLLARFDNYQKAMADIGIIKARLRANKVEIAILEAETRRYRYLAQRGAFSKAELESKELGLQKLVSANAEAEAQLRKVKADALDASLLAPIDGTVLIIHAREGELAGSQGVMVLGDSRSMEVVAQVDESDIQRISIGQKAIITSENGAFPQELHGRVIRIKPLVSQRQRLSTRVSQDMDTQERVIEIIIQMNLQDSRLVNQLTNSRVVAVFPQR